MVKLEGFLLLITSGITLYSFIECAMRDEDSFKKFPKWGWLLIIFFFNLFGSIYYLAAGRQGRNPGNGFGKKQKPRIIPPDDNPDFLRGL
jgi:hypothetical protein